MSKISNFACFVIPGTDLINRYSSPVDEISIAKNIPISLLDSVRTVLRQVSKVDDAKFKIRYRGPRHDSMRQTCLKGNARCFAVYFR